MSKTEKKEKKEKSTDIICILDMSGSMRSLKDEVIGAFNRFVTEQQELPGKAKLSLILFDDVYELIHDRIALDKVPELTSEVYSPRGMTALNDAIGKTILNMKKKDKKKVICMIQTDGAENASQEFSGINGQNKIKELIKEKEELGWKFMFLGANIDAQQVATGYGMAKGSAMTVGAGAAGVNSSYATMSIVTRSFRESARTSKTDDKSDTKDN